MSAFNKESHDRPTDDNNSPNPPLVMRHRPKARSTDDTSEIFEMPKPTASLDPQATFTERAEEFIEFVQHSQKVVKELGKSGKDLKPEHIDPIAVVLNECMLHLNMLRDRSAEVHQDDIDRMAAELKNSMLELQRISQLCHAPDADISNVQAVQEVSSDGRTHRYQLVEVAKWDENFNNNNPNVTVRETFGARGGVHRGVAMGFPTPQTVEVALGITGRHEHLKRWAPEDLRNKFLVLPREAPVPPGLQPGHKLLRVDGYSPDEFPDGEYTVIDLRDTKELPINSSRH